MEVYRKNYLTNVIARIDFDPIFKIESTQPANFQETIRDSYPRLEKIQQLQFVVGGNAESKPKSQTFSWRFANLEKNKIVSLASDSISYEVLKYTSYADFGTELEFVLSSFNNEYKPGIIKRIGLRYINQIKLEGDPFDWSGVINDKLYGFVSSFQGKSVKLSRAMSQMHLKNEDSLVLFQYGIHNSEYPNSIAAKEFILDYDCSNSDENEYSVVCGKFRMFNETIRDLFEASIGETLRTVMRGD